MEIFSISTDLEYLAVFSGVLLLPKMLLRFQIPPGITALLLGVLAAQFDGALIDNQLFRFLSQLGITSLFVFAGFEVDFDEINEDRSYLGKYLIKSLVAIGLIAFGLLHFFDLGVQDSIIFALGIFTPSAGFILSSLHSYSMAKDLEYWVKSKAISKEIISVFILFLAMQGDSLQSFLVSVAFFVFLIVVLPFLFRFFFKFISPFAPNSEVTFLVVLSLVAGVLSKEVGAYYLVGAFVVGLVASRFKKEFIKKDQESLFDSLSSFFTVFLPFYFFMAGLKIKPEEISSQALTIGIAFVVIFVPIRILLIKTSIKLFLKQIKEGAFDISLSLMPTLIFGLVISSVLTERASVPAPYIYALIIYTVITSVLPSILFSLKSIFKK